MARFNEILVGRYNRFLQKFLSIKGGPPAPQLSSEIAATWALFHGVENRYLEAWERFAKSTTVAAVAAVPSAFQFRNPANSNIAAVFEKLQITESLVDTTGAAVYLGAGTTDLATTGIIGNRLDPRGRPQSSLLLSQQAAATAAIGGQIILQFLPTASQTVDEILFEDQELTLLPGDVIRIISGVNNVALTVAALWRERLLEESELK